MSLFRAKDRNVGKWQDASIPAYLAAQWEHPDDDLKLIYYTASIESIRDRLELQGYTVRNCCRLFEEWRTLEIRCLEARGADNSDGATPQSAEQQRFNTLIRESRLADLQRLRELSVDNWLENVRYIVENHLTSKDADSHRDSYLGKMLEWSDHGWYGYGGPDPLVAIRLAIEVFPSADAVVYDLTDLVLQECVEEDGDPIERLIDWSTGEYHSLGRVIILTEGRTDANILKRALDLLFPHVAGYFSFMDFAEYGGGAGQLANLVRAFAGAGIVNRVVAIFDNDAAALAAMQTLRKTSLPKHIVAMRLPDMPMLTSYPTLGPNGPSLMNINGMAASIELYLGADVLQLDSGNFAAIQWTGYERSIGKYQGELVSKQEVQERFREKLAKANNDPRFRDAADWSGLRLVFTELFKAFHALDGEMLSEQLRYVYREQ
jgi:HEPN/Toprim N-terminal domain 1